MRRGQCFVLVQFCVITLATKPRSVNLALETTFEFNNKQDVSIIQKVRNFLNKIENVVDKKLAKRNGETTEFTDFLQDLISTINTYEDDDFKQVFRVLDNVVHNFKSKDNKFNQIYNERLKYILANMLKKINKAPAKFLRSQLKKNLRVIQKKDINLDFLKFLNMIYKKKSSTALKQTLDNFKNYGKKTRTSDVDMNLKDIIEKAVKSIIYDQYNNLNSDSQKEVQIWIKELTKNPDDDDDSLKRETPKIHYKKKKHDITRDKYTFVTLYPEMITYNIKYLNKISRQKKREKNIKEKYNDYKVKEFSPVSNDGSNSSSSLEYDWQTRPTRKRKVTPQWHTIPRPLKVRVTRNNPFGIYNNAYKFQLPQMLRRTELDEKDSNKTNNETCPKEIITANYLSKIKNLEDELQRVREQLKAKITTLKKDNHGTDDKEIDKDNELYFRVSDLSSPVTLKRDLTKRPKMMEYKLIELKNKTEDNTTKYSEEFSHESREMSFDVPYNMTYRSTNQSIYISNQTSMEIFSPETTFKYNITTIKPIINIPKVTNTTYLNEIENTTKLIKENNTVSQEISN
ncbi:PREDICTED: uncharacterized protein LOC106114759 [Papilio xuthus]|uniref:Uncharacterized protein LOC106114759 n=1 Tax=Papilio xuthus TaxID=66420 RepID=A0AAJ6Z232_PAPXU|nr:PREDICTED: uncharacterized protein LOC106114759 [Papilio xuthus]